MVVFMRGRKKMRALLAALVLCGLLLTGCGGAKVPETVTVPTISVSDKGVITSYLVGDFDKNYYNISELSKMVMDEAEKYNGTKQQEGDNVPVAVDKVEMAGDGSARAVVTLTFDSQENYKEYCKTDFFYGTVEQALEAGYQTDTELINVKKAEDTIGGEEISQMGGKHIMILEEKATVVCPRKVLYLSQGLVMNQDGTVDATQGEGLSYIIMK